MLLIEIGLINNNLKKNIKIHFNKIELSNYGSKLSKLRKFTVKIYVI